MLQGILCGLLCALAQIDYDTLQLMFGRPIFSGMLTGLIMGDVTTGLMVGVELEIMFLATLHVGSAFPPDAMVASIIATAFAVAAGGNTAVAIASALPLAVIGQIIFYLKVTVIAQWFAIMVEKKAAIGDTRGMTFWHVVMPIIMNVVLYGVPTFLAVYVSGDLVQTLINYIPEKLINGINAGAGMLAAVGLAMLLKSVNAKGVWPYLLLGFFLAAFLNVSTIGIAIVAVIIIAIMYMTEKKNMEAEKASEEQIIVD